MFIFKVLKTKNEHFKHHFSDEKYKEKIKQQNKSFKTLIFSG